MSKRVSNKKGIGSRNKCYANRLHKLDLERKKLTLQEEDLEKETNKLRQKKQDKPKQGWFRTFIDKMDPKMMFRRTQMR